MTFSLHKTHDEIKTHANLHLASLRANNQQKRERYFGGMHDYSESINPNHVPHTKHTGNIKNDLVRIFNNPNANELFSELMDVEDLDFLIKEVFAGCFKRDEKDHNMLHVAINRGDICLVKLAIYLNPELIEEKAPGDLSPLHLAAEQGFTEAIEWILHPAELSQSKKMTPTNINIRTKVRQTPLHRAAIFGHVETVNKLLSFGADKSNEDSCKMNAADWAFYHYCLLDQKTESSRQANPFLEKQKYEHMIALLLTMKPLLPFEMMRANQSSLSR